MKRKKVPASEQALVDRVRELEQRLYPDQLHDDRSMMKTERRFWHFRPSHHIATGLITQEDVTFLSQPGRRLLSVGASPAFLERLLPGLGIPAENITVTDSDPAIVRHAGPITTVTFDMNDAWPDTGTFDRIIFPESLCIAIGDRMKEKGAADDPSDDHRSDPLEAELLAAVLRQALRRLRPGGVIRANGPMSHPNVVRMMREMLREEGMEQGVEYRRFFLVIR